MMKQSNDFAFDMVDMDIHKDQILYYAGKDIEARESEGTLFLDIPFFPVRFEGIFQNATDLPNRYITFSLRAYGDTALRFSAQVDDKQVFEETSEMLVPNERVQIQPLRLQSPRLGIFEAIDTKGQVRMRLSTKAPQIVYWSDLQPSPNPMIDLTFFPDGKTAVPLMGYDQFFSGKFDSVALGYCQEKGNQLKTLLSTHAEGNEHFYGTGERFGHLDLAGRTVILENTDALGTNSRKAYKNIPFFVSSRGYGVFHHTSNHVRLSFSDISLRSVQSMVEDGIWDVFFCGGSSLERVLYTYRCLTGFSPSLPLFSYGMWMGRMTYTSAKEVEEIVDRLREEAYPCDVIHLDTGYFERDWVCEWSFSKERFPNPAAFIQRLRDKGIRLSVWQTPNVGTGNKFYEEAVSHGYIPNTVREGKFAPVSDFSGQEFGGQIDFSNPDAVLWYKEQLRRLLNLGVAVIKTDFGEKLAMQMVYSGLPASKLHNRYALLYQKAAFEVTAEYCSQPFIWARAAWAGCQRYPLHWGGDTVASWDGMYQTLHGGLQFAMSGFTYWSHDIPGFHGNPDFMNSRPSAILYLRWTQFGVFTSHMRYHGSSEREPWAFPEVSSLVRLWLRLRYALIPYIQEQGDLCSDSGRSLVSPLVLDYNNDQMCFDLDDQYMFGTEFLVAPIFNEEGTRNVYLPQGTWVDFFSGRVFAGKQWIARKKEPLSSMPLFVRKGARIPIYPLPVSCTDDMVASQVKNLVIGEDFKGIASSLLGSLVGELQVENNR
jgi:alpha-D-xyloside xylohydrolase